MDLLTLAPFGRRRSGTGSSFPRPAPPGWTEPASSPTWRPSTTGNGRAAASGSSSSGRPTSTRTPWPPRSSRRSSSTTTTWSRWRGWRRRCTPRGRGSRSSSGTPGCADCRFRSRTGGSAGRELVHPLAEPGTPRRVPGRLDAQGDERGGDPRSHRRVRHRRPDGPWPPASTGWSSTLSHGYLPWQFLSPLYNKRTDKWGGTREGRMRFPVEAMNAIRDAIGRDAFMGYRINSTSFWPGDLEVDQVKEIVRDLARQVDLDLRKRLGRGPPLLHSHPDALRGRLGAELRGRDPQGVVPAGAAGRPDHHPGGGRRAAQERPRGRHLPRPGSSLPIPNGRTRRRRAARTTSGAALRPTSAGATPRPASASSASTTRPSGARAPWGGEDPRQGPESPPGRDHRGRAGGARMRAGSGGARPSGHRVRARGADGRARAHPVAAPDRGEFASAGTWLDGQARKNGARDRHRGTRWTRTHLDDLLARERAGPRRRRHPARGCAWTASRAGPRRRSPAGRPATAWLGRGC